jgi:uncharacterized protein
LVAKAAIDAGVKSLAITVDTPLVSQYTLKQAAAVAQEIGISHLVVNTDFIPHETSPYRCYVCKTMMAERWHKTAISKGFHQVADGVTVTDLQDARQPGAQASEDAGIWHPLAEVGMDDGTVRTVARALNLSFWNAPTDACLASRIAFGERITREKLRRIEAAESFLRTLLGNRLVRVRLQGALVRIEVAVEDLPQVIDRREVIAQQLRALDFSFTTLDFQSYRSGSMHEE